RRRTLSISFTRFVAWLAIGFGALVIVLGIVLAVVAWQVPSQSLGASTLPLGPGGLGRAAVPALLVVAGLALGAPFIVFGQLVLVFLDMRRRLVRIDGRLRRVEAASERESPQTERLRLRPRGI